MNMPEIKACPFCGSKDVIVNSKHRVTCMRCGGAGPDCESSNKSAILEWNIRAGDERPLSPETVGVKALASATCCAATLEYLQREMEIADAEAEEAKGKWQEHKYDRAASARATLMRVAEWISNQHEKQNENTNIQRQVS